MAQKASGSEKLLGRVRGGCTLSKSGLEQLVDIVRQEDLNLVDWQCFGQPQPDFVQGRLQVKPDRLPDTVSHLIDLEELPLGFEIFPLGIPVPELFEVTFKSQGR